MRATGASEIPRVARSFGIVQPGGLITHLKRLGRAGRTCLLIHGFGEGSYVWNEFLPTVPPLYEVFAIDLRGHGDSDWDPEARYDVQTHVADVVHAIRVLRLHRLVLIGHSMGAEIAVRAAMECAKRMMGLVLVDFGPSLNPEGIRLVRARFEASNRAYRCEEDYASWLAAQRPLVSRDVLLRLAGCALREQASAVFRLKADPASLRSAYDEPNDGAVDTWSQMCWPVLLVRGAGSAVLSCEIADRMVKLMPDARLQLGPISGHSVMLDNPEGLAATVRPFLLHLLERQ